MLSTIKVAVDFENGNKPIIQVNLRKSEDLRDNFIQAFVESFGHTSSWCRVTHDFSKSENGEKIMNIHPITPDEIYEQAKIMTEQGQLLKGVHSTQIESPKK